MERRATDWGRRLGGGAVAGLVAGLVLSALLILLALSQGQDVWPVVKGAGAPFLGERVRQPGFDLAAVVVGFASHMAVSLGWGVLFGLIFYGLTRTATLVAGIIWGLVVWVMMFYVVLPLIGLGGPPRGPPDLMSVIGHLVFGFVCGAAFVPFQNPLRRYLPPRFERPQPVGR